MKLQYKRILLKLSGEALGSNGISHNKLNLVVKQLRALHLSGVELAVVIGGGNIWRKRNQGQGFNPVAADYLGMIATIMNALALKQALEKAGVKTQIQSAINIKVPGTEKVNAVKAQSALARGQVVIFAGGTGKPFFTTDTAAALQAAAIKAEVIIKASTTDGVYTADPKKFKSAKKLAHITIKEAIKKNLGIMDKQAFKICQQRKIPIVVCKWGSNLVSIVQGKKIGTHVLP